MMAWAMPLVDSRPLRVIAESSDNIWLTENAPSANSIAHLTPSTGVLNEFPIPTPNSEPWSLLHVHDKIWFVEYAGNNVGSLDPALASSTTTTLSPVTLAVAKSVEIITPSSYPALEERTPAVISITDITKAETGGFAEFALPISNSGPVGLDFNPATGHLWFTENVAKQIGMLDLGTSFDYGLFLPLVFGN
jgi:streptogramin lyase